MNELLGNPESGTLLAWLADGGLWAILIGIGAVAAWLILRIRTRSWRRWFLERLDDATPWLHLQTSFAQHQRLYDTVFDLLIGGVVIGGGASLAALTFVGIDVSVALNALAVVGRTVRDWGAEDGAPILVIVLLAFLISRMLRRAIPRLVRRVVIRMAAGTIDREEAAKRSDTLTSVIRGTADVLVVLIAGLMILSELSIPIGPVLGGLGVAGIAVGFGAQWLIRDLINGIFIIAENQYRQGDVVTVGGVTGLVEGINLRRTTLRDLDGKVHSVPNGEVTMSTNWTKNWSRVNLDVGVAYRTSLEHAFQVLNRIGQELAEEPYWAEKLIEPPQVLRVNSFDDSAVTIKVLGVCRPLTQWEIMGEMRRRIKERFDEEGIEIPFPHRTIYWGMAAHPLHPPAAAGETEPAKIARLLTRAEELSEEDIASPSQFSETEKATRTTSETPTVKPPADRRREASRAEPARGAGEPLGSESGEEDAGRGAGGEGAPAEAPAAEERARGKVTSKPGEGTERERESTDPGTQEQGEGEERRVEQTAEPASVEDENISEEEQKLLEEAEKTDQEREEEARRQADILARAMDE